MRQILTNARLVDATGERPGSQLTINGAKIIAVGDAKELGENAIDLGGAIVTPGFIDVHTHGGGGFDLHTEDPAEIRAYARWAPGTGTTSFLIGVVGVPGALPEVQLRAAVAAHGMSRHGAEPLGIHLEGPYISYAKRGAHDPAWLRTPDEAETERILELTEGHLRLVTIAPELPGAHAMIRRLVEAGVTASIGHTDATLEQAREGIAQGITHATHCLNAMPPLHHRKPGAMGAILESPQVRGELIADGVHLHSSVLRAMVRALGPDRTVVVTDALPCAGCADRSFNFAGRPARVVDGAARLEDGTITGSALTMDQALRNLVGIVGAPLHEAVGMLSLNPARSARAEERKGLLKPGYDADLLIFDDDLRLQATFCRGTLAYATPEWGLRLGM